MLLNMFSSTMKASRPACVLTASESHLVESEMSVALVVLSVRGQMSESRLLRAPRDYLCACAVCVVCVACVVCAVYLLSD